MLVLPIGLLGETDSFGLILWENWLWFDFLGGKIGFGLILWMGKLAGWRERWACLADPHYLSIRVSLTKVGMTRLDIFSTCALKCEMCEMCALNRGLVVLKSSY